MFKLEQTFNSFDCRTLYAHKYKMEPHTSSAVTSNVDKAQKSAQENKLKTSLKRSMYSETSDKSCLNCTAYSTDSTSSLNEVE